MRTVFASCVLLWAVTGSVVALEVPLPPDARQISERISPLDSYQLPLGAYRVSTVPLRTFEGRVVRRTWRIGSPDLTTLQILAPIRDALEAQDYDILFHCADRACGGFDFRFAIEVVPAPDMYVDIRDYRFLAARKGEGDALSLLISRSLDASYLQLIRVVPEEREREEASEAGPAQSEEAASDVPERESADVAARLSEAGHAVLYDLVFRSGATRLEQGRYAALSKLAAYLGENPGVRVALVGHTDSIGSLDQNIALSKQRAESVRDRLLSEYGIAPARVEAEGMGYLAPIASNLTAQGREANRRVEVILLSQD